MGKNYFLTGATGFVGRYILKALLERDPGNQVSLLVRESGGVSSHLKVDKLLGTMFSPAESKEYRTRVEIVEGEITLDNLGLSQSAYQQLAKKTNIIFHAAASIEYHLPLEDANRINGEGTRSVLRLAEKCLENRVLERMNHISTAYVTGKQKKSPNAPNDMEFANTYEQSKFYAEGFVINSIDRGLPVTIFRPSIIAGHSETGEITMSNILYRFLLMFSRNMIPLFPCRIDSSLNIIPINHFIDVMFLISQFPQSLGRIYNVTHEENTNIRQLIEFACKEMGVPVPIFVPFGPMDGFNPEFPEQLEPFINYIEQSHNFDISETRELLKDYFIPCGDIKAGIKRTIEYCYHNRLLRRKGKPVIAGTNRPSLPMIKKYHQ